MASDFVKRLDDLVRQELAHMGLDYQTYVAGIDESRGSSGAVIRFHPPYDDLDVEEPEDDLPADIFTARIARRLRVTIEAPDRPAGEE